MISVVKELYTLLVLSSPAKSNWIDANQMASLGYAINYFDNVEAAEKHITTQRVDAIIADDHPEILKFLNAMSNQTNHPIVRPVICVLTDVDHILTDIDNIDILLPKIPLPFLEHQLRRHLQLRKHRIDIEIEQSEISLLKNAIVRNVSHELKTPLLQVKSAVALIAEDDVDKKLSSMAVQATARLETVVKNITLLADSMNGSLGPVLVHESLDHAIRNLRRIWVHKNATSRIERYIEGEIPPILGNQQGLSIVLQQLLDNALKFSKDTVHVQVRTVGDKVHIAVTDKGIGIEPDKIKEIFESFYQIDSSPTRRFGGTGVGLAIVRLIMEKHNVEIDVKSTPGEGSTFAFAMPIAALH